MTRSPDLSAQEIEALKMTQDIIKRMAESSSRTKTIFLAVTAAFATMTKPEDAYAVPALAVYAVLTLDLWWTDARYLRLERQFRKHHTAIACRKIPTDLIFLMDPSLYEVESAPAIMLKNFTMWIYLIAFVIAILFCFYLLA